MFSNMELMHIHYLVKCDNQVVAGFNSLRTAREWAQQVCRNNRDRSNNSKITLVECNNNSVEVLVPTLPLG